MNYNFCRIALILACFTVLRSWAEHATGTHSRGTVTPECGPTSGFLRPGNIANPAQNPEQWSSVTPPQNNHIYLTSNQDGTFRWVVHYEGEPDTRPLVVGTVVEGWRLGMTGEGFRQWFRLSETNGNNSNWVPAPNNIRPQLAHLDQDGRTVLTEQAGGLWAAPPGIAEQLAFQPVEPPRSIEPLEPSRDFEPSPPIFSPPIRRGGG